ncbi:uncharacterized protein PV07_08707 [Cladophialophora immunda]|uniref:Uncharacterized protein n=1 Tax=Cladophialophora immunda TaxID=569365 RepID=A0A0D1ZCU5_9EURO|nr:uncharacterized protein PV07_08707 [Cladophialophora immunda]KIW25541.1 hypothetical protein PV07_08707 [Cladophialophora immunda]
MALPATGRMGKYRLKVEERNGGWHEPTSSTKGPPPPTPAWPLLKPSTSLWLFCVLMVLGTFSLGRILFRRLPEGLVAGPYDAATSLPICRPLSSFEPPPYRKQRHGRGRRDSFRTESEMQQWDNMLDQVHRSLVRAKRRAAVANVSSIHRKFTQFGSIFHPSKTQALDELVSAYNGSQNLVNTVLQHTLDETPAKDEAYEASFGFDNAPDLGQAEQKESLGWLRQSIDCQPQLEAARHIADGAACHASAHRTEMLEAITRVDKFGASLRERQGERIEETVVYHIKQLLFSWYKS